MAIIEVTAYKVGDSIYEDRGEAVVAESRGETRKIIDAMALEKYDEDKLLVVLAHLIRNKTTSKAKIESIISVVEAMDGVTSFADEV